MSSYVDCRQGQPLGLTINIVQISRFRKRKSEIQLLFVNYDKILCKQHYVNKVIAPADRPLRAPFSGIFCVPPQERPHIWGEELITFRNQLLSRLRSGFGGNFMNFGYFHPLTNCFISAGGGFRTAPASLWEDYIRPGRPPARPPPWTGPGPSAHSQSVPFLW